MASKERGGVVDNSSKSAKAGGAGKRVTAPVYNGAQTSAHVASAASTASPVAGVSLAAQLYSRADSLRYATSTLADTLQRLGLYEPAPAKGEDLASGAHDNVLRVINEDLNSAMRFANNVVYSSVYGDGEEEDCGKDCDAEKEVQGAIHKTQFGRSVYGDAQSAIVRLLSIQSMANRINLSLVGVEGPADCRASQVVDSVHNCLCNLADHIDDTVTTLHRVNSDLTINLLGVISE
ncbi:hypothetical protein MPK71_gp074 [Erwinia phage pEa_SNUABM_1]|uniref:Uncharacterized protein n=1 Tax=Erwinia phage pEa_SNUABM_1 TaxID=2869543 RepID=A0AAE8C3C7_9CAUD|nr:hypothetical protein MPK71_gp074 [Erwinia phage pEa_SNUABM_1]QZE57283.1 hypothetical protein pEaSNUABM1_00074 [Erwinia phage pEa_SNUABM_1]